MNSNNKAILATLIYAALASSPLGAQTATDSAHVRAQIKRLDSARVAMDSLRRWCNVPSYQSPRYLRRVCGIAAAAPDRRARAAEDSLLGVVVPPVPPDTQPTPPVPPDPVALPTPTTIAPGGLTAPGPTWPTLTPTFSWSAVSGATGYVLAIRDVAANQIVYPSASGVGPPIPATALTLPANVLAASRAYAWDVTAVNATSKSLASANRHFLTAAAPPPVDTTTPPPVPPDTSKFSGPAELPRVYLNFPYPTPTRTVQVAPGGNLQTALDNGRDAEIVLAGGATWTGNYTVTSCSGSGWITLRSGATLPNVGTRARPSTSGSYAKLVTNNNLPALRVTAAGCRVRLVGVEVTLSQTFTAQHYGLVHLEGTDLVLDRSYVHGQLTSQLVRCVTMNGPRQQVSDSWLSDCHAAGADAQAIWGGAGPGPYRIVNNYLEGSGENIMFGGSDPSTPGLVPSDIEIRGNHIAKPIAWKGGSWLIKNLLELKNAVRVLVEANVFEGSWTHGQTGWAVIVKSANQSGGCAWCRSTDVAFRKNLIRNVGAGINIAPQGDQGPTDTTARRIHIVDNVIDGIGAQPGDRRGLQVLAGVQSWTVERTVISGPSVAAALFVEGGAPCRFADNVWARGQYGVLASGASPGTASLTKGCGSGYQWSAMTMVGASQSGYPAGTTWTSAEPASAAAIRALVSTATAGVVVQP